MQKSRSPHASNRHLAEATGSALPSALLFLFLVSAFLMSLSQRAKFQLVGHQLIQDSYRAQTMALLTEQDIQLTHQHGGPLSVGTYVFNAGDVLVEKQGQDTVQLTVTLPVGLPTSIRSYFYLHLFLTGKQKKVRTKKAHMSAARSETMSEKEFRKTLMPHVACRTMTSIG